NALKTTAGGQDVARGDGPQPAARAAKKRRSWPSGWPLRRSARSRTRGDARPAARARAGVLVAGRAAYNQVKEFSAYALRLLGTHCCVYLKYRPRISGAL